MQLSMMDPMVQLQIFTDDYILKNNCFGYNKIHLKEKTDYFILLK